MNTHKLITAIDNKWEKLQIINKDFTIDYIISLSPKINHFDLIDRFNKLIDLNNQLNIGDELEFKLICELKEHELYCKFMNIIIKHFKTQHIIESPNNIFFKHIILLGAEKNKLYFLIQITQASNINNLNQFIEYTHIVKLPLTLIQTMLKYKMFRENKNPFANMFTNCTCLKKTLK